MSQKEVGIATKLYLKSLSKIKKKHITHIVLYGYIFGCFICCRLYHKSVGHSRLDRKGVRRVRGPGARAHTGPESAALDKISDAARIFSRRGIFSR